MREIINPKKVAVSPLVGRRDVVCGLAACLAMGPTGPALAARGTPQTPSLACGEALFDRQGRAVVVNAMLQSMRRANVVIIGEQHASQRHHVIEATLLCLLARHGMRNLALEMLDGSHIPTLSAFLGGDGSHQAVAQLGYQLEWEARGWPMREAYAPLFVTARRSGLKIVPAGFDEDLLASIRRFGALALPRRMRDALAPSLASNPVVKMDVLTAIVAGNHTDGVGDSQRLAVAQNLKDAFMAHRTVKATGPTLLIAGAEHARRDVGVPAHLQLMAPRKAIISLRLVSAGKRHPLQHAERGAMDTSMTQHDYLWVTQA